MLQFLKKSPFSVARMLFALALLLLLSTNVSCSSKVAVNFVVHSAPEGGHVLYKLETQAPLENSEWIYLGPTPLQAVRIMDKSELIEANKITLKVFRDGFSDQIKEWNGEVFEQTMDDYGKIFWSPRLISVN